MIVMHQIENFLHFSVAIEKHNSSVTILLKITSNIIFLAFLGLSSKVESFEEQKSYRFNWTSKTTEN